MDRRSQPSVESDLDELAIGGTVQLRSRRTATVRKVQAAFPAAAGDADATFLPSPPVSGIAMATKAGARLQVVTRRIGGGQLVRRRPQLPIRRSVADHRNRWMIEGCRQDGRR